MSMAREISLSGDELGVAAVVADQLDRLTSAAVGSEVEVISQHNSAIPYDFGSPATAGIWRVDVAFVFRADRDRTGSYSFFVKLLRHPRLWPGLSFIPDPESQREFVQTFPWHFEPDILHSGIVEILPSGMRAPVLHEVVTVDEDHLTLWSEFVEISQQRWETADFARAAYLLGRLAARRRDGMPVNAAMPEVAGISGPGLALRYFAERRVLPAIQPLRDESFWQQPVLAAALARTGDPGLGADMLALADRLPRILDELDALPQTFAHGDASPQNLLTPAGYPDEILVIDWGFGTLLAVGHDLAQLLVGLAHAGQLDPSGLPEIHSAILPAYHQGLTDEGFPVGIDQVRAGYLGTLATRSALVSIPFELLDKPADALSDELLSVLDTRLRLTRVLLDLCADVQVSSIE